MRMLTLAAGVAAGYVLGTRAGREKYEQIAATARKVADHPKVAQAQEKAKGLISSAAGSSSPAKHSAPAQPTAIGTDTTVVDLPTAGRPPVTTRGSGYATTTTTTTTTPSTTGDSLA